MESIEENEELILLTSIVWVQIIACYLLLKPNRRWWMLPDKRERPCLGAYCTLFLKYKRTNHEEFFKMTRLTVKQFEELLNLLHPALTKASMREFLHPEFRLAFTLCFLASHARQP
ncbi:hypothetical protein ALC57_15777 [Trachymyrmex cornetzi]|uniref:Uncharacterized protein n=1 Tax=Trachymyrmex cornetzi TaxID=471704 RepID=A0A151IW57_9HYME|nr:hypothetical protein ALC57_15777 [Trachymyrmex cornetzi]